MGVKGLIDYMFLRYLWNYKEQRDRKKVLNQYESIENFLLIWGKSRRKNEFRITAQHPYISKLPEETKKDLIVISRKYILNSVVEQQKYVILLVKSLGQRKKPRLQNKLNCKPLNSALRCVTGELQNSLVRLAITTINVKMSRHIMFEESYLCVE